MSAGQCPNCGVDLDPTHAPVARIRGAKVVTFCSTRCADGQTAATSASRPAAKAKKKKTAASFASEPALLGDGERPKSPRKDTRALTEERLLQSSPSIVLADIKKPETRGASQAESGQEQELVKGERASTVSRRRRKRIIVACCAVIFGGMALAIVDLVSPSTPSEVSASDTSLTAPPSPKQEEPVDTQQEASSEDEQSSDSTEITPDLLRGRALEELKTLLSSSSPRIQRIAAMALARSKDETALQSLQSLRKSETSLLNRIEIAYGLARSGDESAKQFLIEKLDEKRRDVRLDAARSLVKLGDDSGAKVLRRMLGLRGHRVGAAGLLAKLGDEAAIRELKKDYRAAKKHTEDKVRIAVALGRAGQSTAQSYLQKIVKEGRYTVGAADALATLGDNSAVEALEKQLATPSMSVRAALALRRLGHKAKFKGLAAAVSNGDEVSKVAAAESILVLTGPKEWSEFD